MSVAVVGAGLAGLAAAIEASTSGEAVTLFDAREHPGGRARTRDEGGFLVNEGAHALYIDGAANQFLRSLDLEPAGGQPDAAGGIGVDY
jgi:phytoene dehydrogenase-like protein